MALKVFKQSLGGGEISPSMYSRITDNSFQTGLAKCLNMVVEPQGPIVRRPGFSLVHETKYPDKKCRLIPFTFSATQTMVLEFGHHYVRFHTDGATLLNDDGTPYEVVTDYDEDELFEIDYTQSVDVVTLVHNFHPPRELRRYSARDWRLIDIKLNTDLNAPAGVNAVAHIHASATVKDGYVRRYVVTTCNFDNSEESVASAAASVICNPYGDGAYNTISWNAAAGAHHYRVYRDKGGIYGYIGETTGNSIDDDNIAPDTSITPPMYDDVFLTSGGITKAEVIAEGQGYTGPNGEITGLSLTQMETWAIWCKGHYKSTQTEYDWESWGQTDNGENGYIGQGIEYPTNLLDYVSATVEIYDAEGSGTGAIAEPIYSTFNDQIRVPAGERWYYPMWRPVKGVRLINGGWGYKRPVVKITITGWPEWSFNKKYKHSTNTGTMWLKRYTGQFYCTASTAGFLETSIRVSDNTGSGAILLPVFTDGKLKSVVIKNAGAGYTAPTATLISNYGSGAQIKLSVANAGDYPGTVAYFQQRRWFAGSRMRPQMVWATKTGTESDMGYSLPSKPTDRIAVKISTQDSNRIRHILPLTTMLLLTASGEQRASSVDSGAITSETISIQPQSYVGSSQVKPSLINNTAIFAAARGGHIREIGYSYQSGGYITSDVCLRAAHLFDNKEINSLAYAKAPYSIIWCVNNEGQLISFTYVAEQQVGAFAQHSTNGTFEHVTVVPEGDEDIVYCVVRRTISGKTVRFIERMNGFNIKKREDEIYLDCSGTYSGPQKKEINGIDWLEGEKVSIVADGYCVPDQVVKDGKIVLDKPASVVHVGLAYNSDIQTLPLAIQLNDMSFGSNHRKNVSGVAFRVIESSSVQVGTDFEHLYQQPTRGKQPPGSPPNRRNGEYDLPIQANWSNDGQVCIRQNSPMPLKISSMTITCDVV